MTATILKFEHPTRKLDEITGLWFNKTERKAGWNWLIVGSDGFAYACAPTYRLADIRRKEFKLKHPNIQFMVINS